MFENLSDRLQRTFKDLRGQGTLTDENVNDAMRSIRTALDRARIEMWNRRMELEIQLPIQDVFVHLNPFWAGRRPQVPEYGRVRQAQLLERMAWLNRELGQRTYIAGETYTVADITAQCAFVMGRATGSKIPEDMTDLIRWYDLVTSRPSARA